jgi:alpha-tubulin suppressor-like RCC1 family protein
MAFMRVRDPAPNVIPRSCATPLLTLVAALMAGACSDSPSSPTPKAPEIEAPPAGFVRFARLSAGEATACGLTAEGAAYCWGAAAGSDRPRRVTGLPALAALDAHGQWGLFLCGLTAMGAAHCHRRGEVVAVPGPAPFAALAAGAAVCARTATGDGYCWTYDTGAGTFAGVLGDGGASDDTYVDGTPVALAGAHRFQAFSSGHLIACGITAEQQAYCWGQHNQSLQMGDGDPSDAWRPAPSPVAGGHAFRSISIGTHHVCGVSTGDIAYCWGLASFGQLGNRDAATSPCPGLSVGTQPGACVASPVHVAGGHYFTTIAAGGDHTCALDREGRAYCWGGNWWGQLGIGRRSSGTAPWEWAPVAVAGTLGFRALEAGYYFTCGIATDDATYCWGLNQGGQLGAALHPAEVRTVPHPVAVAVE